MVPDPLGPTRRNALTVASVAALLVGTHLLLPAVTALDARILATARYGAYLAVFTIWMAWFVATGVDLIADEDEDV